MTDYRNNHYVPVWFQDRFIPNTWPERKFYYLDLRPDKVVSNRHTFTRNAVKRWGPRSCFFQKDLYTSRFGDLISTEIEKMFFGSIDESSIPAVEYFANFSHPSAHGENFQKFLLYLSLQKLRTPRGLRYLSSLTEIDSSNGLLFALQELQALFCAIWTESIWSIVDASDDDLGFLLSDHPVTVYNQGAFPGSKWCRNGLDPHIWLNGTHTLFPLGPKKMLIMTNLSWVRHPYGNPLKSRPNPNPLRPAIFNFTQIQTGRQLSRNETLSINYIIKNRAFRYVAAVQREWLYPEKSLTKPQWNALGENYLLMPDPRSVTFSSEILMGFKDGSSDAFDEYGRKPWDPSYLDETRKAKEWETFLAFQGEFARLFGPRRRGRAYDYGREQNEEDSEDFHRYHLSLEQRHKKHRYRS